MKGNKETGHLHQPHLSQIILTDLFSSLLHTHTHTHACVCAHTYTPLPAICVEKVKDKRENGKDEGRIKMAKISRNGVPIVA